MQASPPSNVQTPLRTSLSRSAAGNDSPSIGQWLTLPGYTLARTVASLPGTDWVVVDCEHGNIDDAAMYHSIGAVAAAGSSPIVRVAGYENWMIKRALDAGAHGIMVPMCESVEQAKAVARFAHYPNATFPQGTRGCGGVFANASFNLSPHDYLRYANDLITVIVQIESRAGLENCEAIAAVDGIDALFIGPNDLASSLGYFAFDHSKIPEVQEATARVLAAVKAKGKFGGHWCTSAEEAAMRLKQGWDFVNCGADVVAITAWMSAEIAKVKDLTSRGDQRRT